MTRSVVLILIFMVSMTKLNICLAQENINKELFLVSVSYIPNSQEIDGILATCNQSNEKCLTNWIFNEDRFKLNIYSWLIDDYLESVTEGEIMNGIVDSEQIVYGSRNMDIYERVQLDYERWKALKSAKQDLISKKLAYQDLIILMLNNPRFDEINMGSDNFVNRTFYLLLNRYPTEYERLNGVKMVEGQSGILFFKGGQGKIDYLDLLVSNDSYVEYQLKYWYEKLTLKEMSTNQLSVYLNELDCYSLDCILKLIILTNSIK